MKPLDLRKKKESDMCSLAIWALVLVALYAGIYYSVGYHYGF